MAGLLDMFQPATPDPLGRVLGASYDAGDQRWAGISKALGAASEAFLHPEQGTGGGWAGAIGQLGGAMGKAGTAYTTGKIDYLKTAAEQEIAKREIERKKRLEDQEIAQDQAWADFAANLTPEQQKMVQGNPELAKAVGAQWAQAQFPDASGSSNVYGQGNLVELGVDKDGNIIYGREQPSLRGGEPLVQPLPKGAKPAWDPSVRGKTKEAEEAGKVTGKTTQERWFEDVDFAQNVTTRIGTMDAAVAGADQFAGMSFDKFIAAGGNPQAWYDWSTNLDSVKATASAAALDEAKLYPMSDSDRKFVAMMAANVDQWNSPERVKKAVNILRESSIKRLKRIKEGTTLQMPDLDAMIKQFEVSASVTPPGDEYEWVRDATGKLVRQKVVR